jgi:hypothetical protein
VDERKREGGYLTVHQLGVVMLNDDEIGTFQVELNDDNEEMVTFEFHRGAAGVMETLEFASEQGLVFGLQLKPEYGSKD